MNNHTPLHLSSRQLDIWNDISGRLHAASEIVLFLDYDGTITPIRNTPAEAVLAPGTIYLLQQLIQLPHITVTIVTGRSMEDIRGLVPLENIGFAANHGFHIYQDGTEWIHPEAVAAHHILYRLYGLLQKVVEPFPVVYLEDKQFTLSIHYRNIPAQDELPLKELIRKTVYAYNPTLLITEGKEVLEIRLPLEWGKGHAVMKILKTHQHSPHALQMYIGDDTTDEDAFQVIPSAGITIHVGTTMDTAAQYFVTDVDEVLQLLKIIVALRTHRSNNRFTSRE